MHALWSLVLPRRRQSVFGPNDMVPMGPAASALLLLNTNRRAFKVCLRAHIPDTGHRPSSSGCWSLSRAALGSRHVVCNGSLSFCLFLSLLPHCGNISFSLVRILALCFLQAHLIFPVLFGNFFFLIKTKDGKTTFAFSSFFLEVILEGLHEGKGGKDYAKANLIN